VYIDKDTLRWNLSGNISTLMKHYFLHPIKRRISRYYLSVLKSVFGVRVIGITGSVGKTTTKDMLYSILERDGKTVASYKNIDPVFNIPSTILKCTPFTKYLVLELGVEFPGEMDYYLWLAKPDIGVITNISATHTEFFGDVDGVFREKSKLVKFLSKENMSVLHANDKRLLKLKKVLKSGIIWFGNGGDVYSTKVKYSGSSTVFQLNYKGKSSNSIFVEIPVIGTQFVQNALAAASVAKIYDIELSVIKDGLERFTPPSHRMGIIKTKSGATILDDSYNNNPEAAKQAINTLYSYPDNENKVIVFGDMLELGKWETKYHMDIGRFFSKYSYPKKLICIGKASKITANIASKYIGKGRVSHYQSWGQAVEEVKKLSKLKVDILIKGSRSIALDKLVAKLS
jgi:UDP-N-acetylmuramoyl-tripeptide--D-alanyl-D-alanine ligase